MPRHVALHPLQFAFNLLTRSGRIGHANLTLRDPSLVRRVDAFVSGAGALAAPPLFAPLRLGALELRNRAVVEGFDAAETGAGLVLSPALAITGDGRVAPDSPTDPGAWREAVERVHAAGAKAMLALTHAGRRGACRPRAEGVDLPLRDGAWPLVSASPIAYTRRAQVPAELDETGMERIRAAFVDAARRGAEAGFDAVEVDLASGCLLASFLSTQLQPPRGRLRRGRRAVPAAGRRGGPRGVGRRAGRAGVGDPGRGRARRRAARGGRRADPRRHRPDHGVRRT